jgi:hypothetical protein
VSEIAVPREALARVAERFSIPIEAVADIVSAAPDTLLARSVNSHSPINGTAPHSFVRYTLGAVRLSEYGGDLANRYVDFLRVFDSAELVNAEAEDGIKRHPSYGRYLDWAKAGIEPPYISVYKTDKGRLQSVNRRRTLVAQELGQPITGWFGAHHAETDLPLKYGDVLDAVRAELEATSEKTPKPSGPGF